MKYFKKTMTLQEVKKAYRQAAIKLHPDKGGDIQEMQKLNNEFEIAFALAKKFNAVQTTENARSYRKTFYTENNWTGSNYDKNLSIKEIAKIIREYVKNAYPTYRFSITSTMTSIYIFLTEYPVTLTNRDLLLNHFHTQLKDIKIYVPSKWYINTNKMTDADIEEWIDYRIHKAYRNESFSEFDTWLHPAIYQTLKDVKDLMNSYNYDASDIDQDCFNKNFYGSVCIGKPNKPAVFVERTARIDSTKQRKDTKQISA